jgi:hypothetical protein
LALTACAGDVATIAKPATIASAVMLVILII